MRVAGDLGPLQHLYRGRTLAWRDVLTLFLPGILAVLSPLGYGMAQANYAYTRFGPVAAEARSYPWFLLATFALAVFILLVAARLLRARAFVAVHRYGVRISVSHFRARSLRWEQIAGVCSQSIQEYFLSLPLRAYFEASLVPAVGKPLRISRQMTGLPELVSHLKAALYPRLLPQLLAEFTAGKWVYFGPVAIQQSGLQIRGRRIPWQQVERVEIRQGFLLVASRPAAVSPSSGAPVKIALLQIPNPELLLQLIQQAVNV